MKTLLLGIILMVVMTSPAKASGISHGLLQNLDQFLGQNEYSPFHAQAPNIVKKMMLDQVYEAKDFQSAIFVKWNVPKRKKRFTIRKIHGGTELYLYKTNYSMAMYFYNVPTPFRERVTALLKGYSRSVSSEVTDVTSIKEGAVSKSSWQVAKKCLLQTMDQIKKELSGSWEGLKGAVSSIWSGKSITQFWGNIKKVWESLKNVVSIFKDKIGQMLKALSNLHKEDLQKVLCAITGAVVPSIITALTGYGALKLATRLATLVPRVQSIAKVLAAYSVASASVRAAMPLEKILENVLNKGEWLSERMQRMMGLGRPDAAMAVGVCE